jgi:hypothetical protein
MRRQSSTQYVTDKIIKVYSWKSKQIIFGGTVRNTPKLNARGELIQIVRWVTRPRLMDHFIQSEDGCSAIRTRTILGEL